MLIAFNVVTIVRALVKASRTFNDIRGFDFRFTSREVGKKNLLRLAVLARETKIPLSGGKLTHSLDPRLPNGREERGQSDSSYKA